MNLKNRSGFTLIELLAVIVILGILMITAIPAVSNTIAKSRRDTYIDNAKKIIDAVRTSMYGSEGDIVLDDNTGICPFPATGKTTSIHLITGTNGNNSALPYLLERGGTKSSFNQDYLDGYVIIYNKSTNASSDYYDYYISLIDKGKNGIENPVKEDALIRGVVKTSSTGASATNKVNNLTPQYTCHVTTQ